MVSGGERKTDWQGHIEKKVYSVYRNWERQAAYFCSRRSKRAVAELHGFLHEGFEIYRKL